MSWCRSLMPIYRARTPQLILVETFAGDSSAFGAFFVYRVTVAHRQRIFV